MRSLKPKFYVNFFIYKRLRNEKYKRFLEKGILKLKNNASVCSNVGKLHSHCQPDILLSSEMTNINPACRRLTIKQPSGKRFAVKPISFHLPPDRYTLPPLQGNKRAYISKLPRTEETIISHLRSMKDPGEFKFYDRLGFADKITNKCAYFKGIFTSNPRQRKPTTRSMTHDINFAVKSPTLGPSTYFPQNYCLRVKKGLKKTKPLFIYKFLPNSAIPETETSLNKDAVYFGSDPTAYYPYHIATCPMPGKCDPDIAYKIEINKINKSRRLPYSKFLINLNIETAFEKDIKGHGHTSRFRCPPHFHDSETTSEVKKMTKELAFNYHPLEYFKMVINPKRKNMSFRTKAELLKHKRPFVFKYLATQKPVIRKKLLETPNLAFGSTQPRFKGEMKPKVSVETKEKKKSDKPKKKSVPKKEVRSRLYDPPGRKGSAAVELKRIKSKLVQYKYSKEPPAKLLIESNYIGDFGTKQLQFSLKDLPYEGFFKRHFL